LHYAIDREGDEKKSDHWMKFPTDDAASATPTAYTPSHSLFATSENCSSFSHSETVHHFLISHFDFEISFENCAGKKKNVVK